MAPFVPTTSRYPQRVLAGYGDLVKTAPVDLSAASFARGGRTSVRRRRIGGIGESALGYAPSGLAAPYRTPRFEAERRHPRPASRRFARPRDGQGDDGRQSDESQAYANQGGGRRHCAAYGLPSASSRADVIAFRARAAITLAALRVEALLGSSRRTALGVIMARASAVTGVPAPSVRLPGRLAGGRLGVRVRGPMLRVVMRPVPVPPAVHEEHRQRAREEEEQKDQSRRVHRAPPFVFGLLSASAVRVKST